MKDFKLSVVMPNYNHAHYLYSALKSILTQSWPPDFIIVVDDASNDESINIVKNLQKEYDNLRLMKNTRNMGVYPTINKGVAATEGEFLFLPAADDVVLPGHFEKSLKMLNKFPIAAMCFTDIISEWIDKKRIIKIRRSFPEKYGYFSPQDISKMMRKKIFYLSSFGSIMRRQSLEETGLLEAELKWSTDRIFSIVLALRFGACYIPEYLAYQRRGSTSYSEVGLRNRKEHRQVIKNILELLKKPQYSDVLPKIKKSCALASFGMPMLRVLFFSPKHRDYFSFNLIRLILWDEFKNKFSKYCPEFIKKVYRNFCQKLEKI